MTIVAICLVISQRMRLSGIVMEIWHLKDIRGPTSYGWSLVTMCLSGTIT